LACAIRDTLALAGEAFQIVIWRAWLARVLKQLRQIIRNEKRRPTAPFLRVTGRSVTHQ
jgi:hypothetical protein